MARPRSRRRRGNVPDAELEVLKVLWDRGTATIREIADVLYPGGDTSHYATVQKLLERLQERGCVARRRHARVNVYRAKTDRNDLIREQLQDAADKLCAGSMTPLLTQLVDPHRLTPKDIQTLRALVERLERGGE